MDLEILPLAGVGPLRLGCTRTQAKDIMGQPTSIRTERYGTIPDTSELWTYESVGLELAFQSNEGSLLGCISVHSSEAQLQGEKLVGLEEGLFLAQVRSMGLVVSLDEEFESVSARDYACEEANLMFWVEGGFLECIEVMPRYDENDAVVWPAAPDQPTP